MSVLILVKRGFFMKYFLPIMFGFLLLAPGCANRFSDWSSDHVEQGIVRAVPKKVVLDYLRTARIYKDFSTRGFFDALWLSDEVRTAYVDLHAAQSALAEDEKQELLHRQLAENEKELSFYLLSHIPDTDKALGEEDCSWTVALRVNGILYKPKNITEIEFGPEYALLLKTVTSRHKNNQLVTFALKDERGRSIITRKTRLIELVFSTVDRSAVLTWHLDKRQQLLQKNEE